jgi:hypothetical protein
MGDAEARDCAAWKMKLTSTIECYRPPPKSRTSAYVVARIVPVASDDENSLVRGARADTPHSDNGFDEAVAHSQGEDNADGV